MDNIFIINPSATISALKNAVEERLIKVRAITSCLLCQDHSYRAASSSTLHGTIWAIDNYIDEIERLIAKLLQG